MQYKILSVDDEENICELLKLSLKKDGFDTLIANDSKKAIEYAKNNKGAEVFNLGTGNGYSVLEMVNTFSEVNKVAVPYEITSRRPGDIAACYANADKAHKKMNWKAEKNLEEMCKDSWNWQVKNPTGY